ncbi:MAG: AAA family ATPase [Chloroflexota bacterium]
MRCPACEAENSDLSRFCGSCGSRLTETCPHCTAPVSRAASFCTTCGGALPARRSEEADERNRALSSERRRVSVLFADLVNFTGLAESLDPEEVRAIQSRYFEAARSAIATFGGTIEKFIGDAVVAVWGAPLAHEDDAERAVRAALRLVEMVPRAASVAGPRLAARAAVATGEAAVTIGAEGQGIVSGDIVNIAARLQSAAPSGGVLVDERTRTGFGPESPVTFGPGQALQLKGKASAVEAFEASLSERPSNGRSAAHTGAFVGRSGEIRDLISLFDAAAGERRSRTASVLGIAGIGKSRLAWELQLALRSRPQPVAWYAGRARAYGDGIVFAAVRDIVRARCGIVEQEDAEVARRQLAATLRELVRDAEECAWIEPRLAVLLESGDAPGFEREELFTAWRRFLEGVSDRAATVLVFEDLHWADAGLLDFIEHLASWTRQHPILIMTLARPELLDRRPTWGAGQRAWTTVRLDRLNDDPMRTLIEARAHGIPGRALSHILDRAGGVPLYAVELVRMLIDRGQLVPSADHFRLARPLDPSDVPDSLHGILAARIDALPAPDRSLLMSAAVLGTSFTSAALSAVSGLDAGELARRVSTLVQRELLARDGELQAADRRRFTFVQDLVRELAYRTIARADRAAMHLAVARHLDSLDGAELVERVASHLASAYEANPTDPAVEASVERARELFRHAARRALAVHSPDRALVVLERALTMAPGDAERRLLLEEAASAARLSGRLEVAEHHLRTLLGKEGEAGEAGDDQRDRHRAQLASVLLMAHHNAEALGELESAVGAATSLAAGDPEPSTTELIAQLARATLLVGRNEDAVQWADRARAAATRHGMRAVSVDALVTRGTARFRLGLEEAGLTDLRAAVEDAHAADLLATELRARNNLAWLTVSDDPRLTFRIAADGGELAAQMGLADWAVQMADVGCLAALDTGDWDWALATYDRFEEELIPTAYRIDLASSISIIRILRGAPQPLAALEALEPIDPATDPQDLASIDFARAWAAFIGGDMETAASLAATAASRSLGAEQHRELVLAARARLWARDPAGLTAALEAIEQLSIGGRAVDAARTTLMAGLAALGGDAAASIMYEAASARWRELELPLDLALARAEQRAFAGGSADAEADELLERLGAAGLGEALRRMAAESSRPAADARA